MTNTNWQSYGGETTMSQFSQMAALTVQNFVSAATGATIAAALARGFIGHRSEGVGNFWADLTRTTLYVLLPASIVLALTLVALGVPQTLAASAQAATLEGGEQKLSLFAVASQLAIKQLGINGGGIFNVNSAHPFENPTPLTNFLTAVSINVMGWAAFFAFGRSAKAFKDLRALVAAAAVLLSLGASGVYLAETQRPRPWSPRTSTPAPTWRARRSASARPPRPPGLPRPPAPPTARSTPCTAATCRWAAGSRCS